MKHCTNTGRVVYDRKKHFLQPKDFYRMVSTFFDRLDASDGEKTEEIVRQLAIAVVSALCDGVAVLATKDTEWLKEFIFSIIVQTATLPRRFADIVDGYVFKNRNEILAALRTEGGFDNGQSDRLDK